MIEFIAHLHPVIVHLPIGILLFGAFLMIFQNFSSTNLNTAISLAFLLGSISAIAACIAGWLLSLSGEYDAALIFKHQWTGIATAILGCLVYVLKQYRKLLVILLIVLITITGHFGATITHGENYLFNTSKKTILNKQDTIKNQPKEITSIVSNGKDSIKIVKYNIYENEIAPILKTKCYECHSSLKQKNLLRLDTEAFIKKGGKSGLILFAGDFLKSPLYTNLILPLDDDKHMPPKGKHQLSNNEINSIQKWILSGASFNDRIDTLSNNKKQSAPHIDSVFNKKEIILNNTIVNKVSVEATTTNLPPVISNSIIEEYKNQNIILSNLQEGSPFVMANFVNVIPFENSSLLALQKIEKQLVALKLSNLPIKDADIKIIASLSNIKRLNLENTTITNACIPYLKELPALEQLNLYGTNITDEGLKQLSSIKNLSVIYLWKTKVTENGIEQFKKERPNVIVEMGDFKFQKK
jgi:hypothetical protein